MAGGSANRQKIDFALWCLHGPGSGGGRWSRRHGTGAGQATGATITRAKISGQILRANGSIAAGARKSGLEASSTSQRIGCTGERHGQDGRDAGRYLRPDRAAASRSEPCGR